MRRRRTIEELTPEERRAVRERLDAEIEQTDRAIAVVLLSTPLAVGLVAWLMVWFG